LHSRYYLKREDFVFRGQEEEYPLTAVVPEWSPRDRVVVVAPDVPRDLSATAPLVLALTQVFYDRPEVRASGFFDYPSHFVVAGESDASPKVLGPDDSRWWSAAWCRLDVWPSTHHVIADPEPAALFRAVVMLEPDRLLWPTRLALPERFDAPAGPDHADVYALLRNRLRQVILYSDAATADHGEGAWTVRITGRSKQLMDEAVDLVKAETTPTLPPARFRPVAVDDFLGG